MKQLEPGGYARACRFLSGCQRPLDRALYRFHFEAGSREDVLEALRAFRNPDGGFGRALEPDFRLPDSSVMATTTAFHVLREVGAPARSELVRGGVAYLVERYEPERPGWRDVPPAVNDHPHAPWWDRPDGGPAGPEGDWGMPDADVVAVFHAYPELVASALLEEVTELALARLAAAPAPVSRYAAFAFQRLAAQAPPDVREPILGRLRKDARSILDLEHFDACEFQPWWLAPEPGAPLVDRLEPELGRSLEREIERQSEDGHWEPRWSWGDRYPDAWETARREWRGEQTLATLRALRAWGRIRGL
jgi:hypothetical protein